jgi:hypothetical protein
MDQAIPGQVEGTGATEASGNIPEASALPPDIPTVAALRFPSKANRQRSSNINAKGPELEFLQTSLDTCIGTIAQQEAELRKLKEALDIRNKRIIQLEAQVGHAADHLASRVPHNNPEETSNQPDNMKNIDKNVAVILSKLEDLSKSSGAPINHFNIHNNSVCHKEAQPTDVPQCKNCDKTASSGTTPDDHTTNGHGTSSPTADMQDKILSL